VQGVLPTQESEVEGSQMSNFDDFMISEAAGKNQEISRLLDIKRELLAALKEVEEHHVEINKRAGRPQTDSQTLAIVRAAIAKATGTK
jgi:acid stress-induced BolA-like protein IbaG/YrbA